jgi:DNA polymerase IV (DinB-like DNA polymerase)
VYDIFMRIIAHLDMDAFFASVEERDNPRLAGRPIVVGADPEDGHGRGVVSTANYAARAYGIRSALPISTAWRYSEVARAKGLPPAAFLEVNMQKYARASERIMAIVRKHVSADRGGGGGDGASPLVEQTSVDEASFDLSLAGSYERAEEIAREIKKDIKEHEHLTATIGVGPNKLIAKIASDRQKPDGLTVVREEDAEQFLEPLGLRVIPGVGPKSEEQFLKRGMRTVRDAKRLSRAELTEMMGKWGTELYDKLRGRSDAPLVMDSVQKSISEQTTFDEDVPVGPRLKDRKLLEATLGALAEDVYANLCSEIAAGAPFTSFRSIGITVRFADFTTKTRIVTLKEPVPVVGAAALKVIQFQALRLFMPFLDRRENPGHKAIRLLGIKVERFGLSKNSSSQKLFLL